MMQNKARQWILKKKKASFFMESEKCPLPNWSFYCYFHFCQEPITSCDHFLSQSQQQDVKEPAYDEIAEKYLQKYSLCGRLPFCSMVD